MSEICSLCPFWNPIDGSGCGNCSIKNRVVAWLEYCSIMRRDFCDEIINKGTEYL